MGTPTENVELITVEHTNGTSTAELLNLTDKLAAIRIVLVKESFMKATDVFLLGKAALKIKDEAAITLGQFLDKQPKSDDNTTKVLRVGASVKPFEKEVDYSRLDNTQKLAFLTSEISNIKLSNGLCIEAENADKVKLVRKFHKLYRFARGYLPSEMKPTKEFDFESLLTFSEETHSMQTSGVNKTTVSLTTPWVSGEASFEQAKKNSSSSGKVRSYFTERHVCNKVDLSIDPDQIVPDYEFVKKLKAAVMNKRRGVDKFYALVTLLNEWGWYAPLQITLGSALYAIEIKETDSYEQAQEQSTKFDASFKAEISGFGGGAGHGEEHGSESEDKNNHKKEHMIFYQIGGASLGQGDIPGWSASLKDATTWNIITFQKLYPTLRIIGDSEPEILSECLRVLRENHSNTAVKDLQKFIDVAKYEYEITREVSATWEYINRNENAMEKK